MTAMITPVWHAETWLVRPILSISTWHDIIWIAGNWGKFDDYVYSSFKN